MTTRLNPYLSFSNNARQAMEFYQSVLGGDLRISTFGEFGGAPEGLEADNVMHAMLEAPSGMTLMASDTPPEMSNAAGEVRAGGSGVALSLSGEDGDELRGYWERLSARGSVTMPLQKQMWGDEFGMLVDEFGNTWMVNITSPENAGS
jgi:PhnB protein